jgi:hypothetical protein
MNLFGNLAGIPYTPSLGLEIQHSPLTHPIWCCDSNMMYLMESAGGAAMQASRNGLSFFKNKFQLCLDSLFQSILIIDVYMGRDYFPVEEPFPRTGQPPPWNNHYSVLSNLS